MHLRMTTVAVCVYFFGLREVGSQHSSIPSAFAEYPEGVPLLNIVFMAHCLFLSNSGALCTVSGIPILHDFHYKNVRGVLSSRNHTARGQ